MTTTEAILNYAVAHGGSFRRKDIQRDFAHESSGGVNRAVDLQISRLIAAGILRRKCRGEYQITENSLTRFVYDPSEMEKSIYQNLKRQYPFLDFCIWSPRVLTSFMLHIPDIGFIFIDVEKEGMEPVFHTLQNMNIGRNILLAPSALECDRYLTGTDSIVVRQLIGQSPLMEVSGCVVPRIEKILVDVVGDNELSFAKGSELYYIYEDALRSVQINKNKLMRYASRRNRDMKVAKILEGIDHD